MARYDEDLIEAARNADIAKMQEALSAGADPNYRDQRGATPLIGLLRASSRTVSTGTTEVSVDGDGDITKASFIMITSSRSLTEGERSVVENLLNSGADINARDKTGATALMYAAAFADKPYVELLLERQADPSMVDMMGSSSLQWAAGTGKADVIQLLLDHGCDPNIARPMDGATALMMEACFGSAESVQALISGGADVHVRASDGKTALDGAREAGNEATAAILQSAM